MKGSKGTNYRAENDKIEKQWKHKMIIIIKIKIFSEDYLKYLDERFTLTSDFTRARGFNKLVRDIYAEWIPYMIRRFPRLTGFEKVLESIGTRVEVEIVN